jgi:hypothetical protein
LARFNIQSNFKDEPTWEQSVRVIPGINALMSVTNMGEYEKAMDAMNEQAAEEARTRIDTKERITESAKSGESIMDFLKKEKPETLGQAKELYAMRERIQAKGSNDPIVRVLSQGTSGAQKRAAIKSLQGQVPDENLATLLDAAEDEKLISPKAKFGIYIDLYNGKKEIYDEPTIKDVVESYQRMPKKLQEELYPMLEKAILASDEYKQFSQENPDTVSQQK